MLLILPNTWKVFWWLLKQIHEKGLLYKGYTIQPYSPKAGTGLSSHELNQPGTYQEVSDTTVTGQFETLSETLPESLQGSLPLFPTCLDNYSLDLAFKYGLNRWS